MDDEKKLCPLRDSLGPPEPCRGEQCAWYVARMIGPDKLAYSCAVAGIADSLQEIARRD